MKKNYALSFTAILASLAISAQSIETPLVSEDFEGESIHQSILLTGDAQASYISSDYSVDQNQSIRLLDLSQYGSGGNEPAGMSILYGQTNQGPFSPLDSVSASFDIGPDQTSGSSAFGEWINGELQYSSTEFSTVFLQSSSTIIDVSANSLFTVSGITEYDEQTFKATTKKYAVPRGDTELSVFTYNSAFSIQAMNQTTQKICTDTDPFIIAECICIDEGEPGSTEYDNCVNELIGSLYQFQPKRIGIDNLVATAWYHDGCLDQAALNYDSTATYNNNSCVYAEDLIDIEGAPITVPEGIDTTENPIQETLISDPILYCAVDFTSAVDGAVIVSNELFTADSIRVTWEISQSNQTFTIVTDHAIEEVGTILMYVTLYCESTPASKDEQARGNGFDSMTFGSVFTNQGVITDVFASNEEIKIGFFPNPVTGNTISLLENASWVLLSNDGQKLSSGSGIEVNMSDFAAGTYILQINQERSIIVKF